MSEPITPQAPRALARRGAFRVTLKGGRSFVVWEGDFMAPRGSSHWSSRLTARGS
jgi:hypothetical protein